MEQLQAMQQAALQSAHRMATAMIAIWLGGLIITAWVLYMFHARLRDIAEELKRFRIAYQHAQDRTYEAPRRSGPAKPGPSSWPETPNPFSKDAKYMPRE